MLGLTEGVEFILIFFYSVILIRVATSHDAYFNTPFFIFFCTTGICGIASVLSFMTHHFTHLSLTRQWAWIIKAFWIINHMGAIGSLLGKLIIIVNRYSVLRSSDLMENKWSRTRIYGLMAVQFLVPFTTSIKVVFYEYKFEIVNGVEVAGLWTEEGVISSKALTTTYYVVYVVASVIYTILTSRKLANLSSIVGEGNTKQQILRHQKTMFIIVTCCVCSHLIKIIHQGLWGLANLLKYSDEAIWPLYPYANGLATYTAPVVLLIFSSKVRHLFLPKTWFQSTSVNSTTSGTVTSPANAYRI